MTILDKVVIGNSVKVNLEIAKERLSKKSIEAINLSSVCTISDFKITDGKGIGVILTLSNGEKEWFFENEILFLDEKGNIIETVDNNIENKNLIFKAINDLNYKTKSKFNELLNPINFMSWLIFSVKDIL